jgi:hypothetical protein
MLDNKPVNPIENVAPAALDEVFGSVMRNVYLWMALGLMLTGVIAAFVGFSPLVAIVAGQPLIFFGLMIAEIGVVIWLSRGINSMSVTMATLLFFVYATLNGLTLSILFAVYTLGSISLTFFATAGLFGVMSVIGYTTKMDLSKMGSYLFMGLIGLIIASIVSFFWANSILAAAITYLGILLFLALTVYDTQRIKEMTAQQLMSGAGDDVAQRMGILGALRLYLDFINLFLYLLRVLGRRR